MDKEREEELNLNFDPGDGTDDLRLARQELEADLASGSFPEETVGAVPEERPQEEAPDVFAGSPADVPEELAAGAAAGVVPGAVLRACGASGSGSFPMSQLFA